MLLKSTFSECNMLGQLKSLWRFTNGEVLTWLS